MSFENPPEPMGKGFMTKDRLAPFVWLAYLVVPIEGWGLFSGRPLGAFGALAVAAFCWLWWVRRSMPFALLGIAALVAKIALGGTLLAPRGFDAKYYANAAFAEPLERGTEPAGRSFTRTDRRLSFPGGGDDDLPVYFLNDNKRFNFYLPTEPARDGLPVSAVWEGWLRVDRAVVRRVYVRAPGGRVAMALGDDVSVSIPPSPTGWVGYLTPKSGFQRIRISLSIPQGGARTFEAGWTVAGRERPFDTAVVFRQPVTPIRLAADTVLRAISTAFDAMLASCLIAGVFTAFVSAWRRLTLSPAGRDAVAIAWVAVITDALLLAWRFLHRRSTLSGGDDWLSYETMARDIGLNGLWMTAGAALGQGAPFYMQPLYSYFVAASHWLFGDDLYGLFFLQRLLIGGTVIALWRVTAALFGERVGCAGLVAALVIAYQKVGPWSTLVLSELVFVPLVCTWALLLVWLAKSPEPRLRSATGAGVVGGVATLARSTLMLGWVLVLPLLAFAVRRKKRAGLTVAVFAVALCAITSVATVRNWVVARQFVVVSSSGPVNLIIGNPPPPSIVVPAGRKATYTRLGLHPSVQLVVEYARQSPRMFLAGWRGKAAYTLGSYPDSRSLFYMAVASIALVGVLLLMTGPAWLRGAGPASSIPLALALAHFAGLVIFFPFVYGDRLGLAFYALLAPYVGLAAFAAYLVVWRLTGRRAGLIAWLVLFGMCGWRLAGGLAEFNLPLMALAVLVWGLCAFGLPRVGTADAVVYGAIPLGLCIWAAVRDTPGVENGLRVDLLLVVTGLCSSAIVAGGSRLRLPEARTFAWLGAGVTVLAVATVHRSVAGAPIAIMTGLGLGALQSLRLPLTRAASIP